MPLDRLIGRDVAKLRKAGKLYKACCPFHRETTPSFAVYPDGYKCFGCGASGDHFTWLTAWHGMTFLQAVETLAGEAGLPLPEGVAPSSVPIRSKPAPAPVDLAPEDRAGRAEIETVASIDFARLVWKRAQGQVKWPVQTYLEARGIPRAVLERAGVLGDLLFCPNAPFAAWPVGADVRRLRSGPAMVALIRHPFATDADRAEGYPAGMGRMGWPIIGCHVTWLTADFKDNRRTDKGGSMRKMLGSVQGGAVHLGRFDWDVPIAVGEGIETVLSALADLPAETCGLAALSLDNLQGAILPDARGAWPLWNLEPDMSREAFRFRHDAPVTLLCDADMKPLRVQHNAVGDAIGPKVAEAARGRYVIREIGQAERAWICAQLGVRGWQAMGCAHVTAIRPTMGTDFNDQLRGAA